MKITSLFRASLVALILSLFFLSGVQTHAATATDAAASVAATADAIAESQRDAAPATPSLQRNHELCDRSPGKLDEKAPLNFRAKEFSLDVFMAASAKDLTGDVDYGGGIGANYFFTRGFGVGGRVTAWDTRDRFVDEIGTRLIARAPLWDRVAPYGYVEGFYDCQEGRFKDGDFGAGAGGGIELALFDHFRLKGEAGLRVGTDGDGEFIGTGGASIPF